MPDFWLRKDVPIYTLLIFCHHLPCYLPYTHAGLEMKLRHLGRLSCLLLQCSLSWHLSLARFLSSSPQIWGPLSLHKRILIRCFMTNPTSYSLKYKFDVDKIPPSLGFQKYNTILVLLWSLWLYVGSFYTMTTHRHCPGLHLAPLSVLHGLGGLFHSMVKLLTTAQTTQTLFRLSSYSKFQSPVQLVVTKHLFLDILL